MKKLLTILLATAMLLSAASCGAPTDSGSSPSASTSLETAAKAVLEDKVPVEISFWTGTGAANYPFLEKMVADFQQKYPNIKVDFSNQGPITELTQKLTQNIVSKTTPTLSNLSANSFLEYIDAGAIVDLMPYYNSATVGYTDAEKQDFYKSYIDEAMSFGSEGTMYGFPTNKKTADVLTYNKTYFDKKGWQPPKTWDEVAQYSEVIFNETKMPGFSYDTSYADAAFKVMSQQWGSPYIKANGDIDIDNDATLTAMKFYKDNMEKGYFTLPALMPSAGKNNSSNGFVMEECYMFVGAAAGIQFAVPNADAGHKNFELGVAPIPQKESATALNYSKGEDYVIFSNATEEQRVAAWLLVKFLSDPTQNVEWLIHTGNLPLWHSIMDQADYKAFLASAPGTSGYYKALAVNAVLASQDIMAYEKVIEKSADLAAETGMLWQSVMIGNADIAKALTETAAKLR